MSQEFGISAIIPTHNRAEILRRTLESLLELDIPKGCYFEVIVVGNRCSDNTRLVVNEFKTHQSVQVRYFEEQRIGANFARNTGFSHSRYNIIALLDDDLWVDPDWYAGIKEVYDSTDAGIVGGPAELWWEAVEKPSWFADDMEWILSGVYLGADVKEVPDGMGLIGCNLTAKREVFSKVGLFNTSIDRRGASLMGGFESDFMLKASKALYKCYYAPNANVKHWVAPHRIQTNYIMGICEGYGEARIYIKPTFFPRQVLRSIIGHTLLIIRHRLKQVFSRDEEKTMRHKIAQAIGRGGIRGAIRRGGLRSFK